MEKNLEAEKLEGYQYLIDTLTEVGQQREIHGRINDCYESFFNERGCSTQEYDFGIITTTVTRNSLLNIK